MNGEIIYSPVSSNYISILFTGGTHIAIDGHRYDWDDTSSIDDCTLFSGTYRECRKFAEDWKISEAEEAL